MANDVDGTKAGKKDKVTEDGDGKVDKHDKESNEQAQGNPGTVNGAVKDDKGFR